eukprot:TRINITY_DN18027_c0_g1_i3.p1 TRINITY_DN18027_c0_g1~~TRINITY_DN18027_c0_g1_i3.p1  ORF type:complete len:528 (-),score=105.46 TRINITY_DN18027_c0_g1_i3:290-1873(-)
MTIAPGMEHDVRIVLGAIGQLLDSKALEDAAGLYQTAIVRTRLAELEELLPPAQWPDEGSAELALAWKQACVDALGTLSRGCVGFASKCYREVDEGCLALMAPAFEEEEEERQHIENVGWSYGTAAAEVAALGLAALVLGAAAVAAAQPEEVVEGVMAEVDTLAPCIFSGLLCVESEQVALAGPRVRLQRALQGICAWAVAALDLAVGSARLSGRTLWEAAGQDSCWVCALTKGVLSMSRFNMENSPVVAPENLGSLQDAMLLAFLDLPSPEVAFSQINVEDGTDIETRNAQLASHRCRLASATLSCRVVDTILLTASMSYDAPAVGRRLATFLVQLLLPDRSASRREAQPERIHDQGGQAQLGALVGALSRSEELLWYQMTKAVRMLVGAPLRDFLRTCVDLAYFVPPPRRGANPCLDGLIESALAQARDDMEVLGALCALCGNAGQRPAGPLADALRRSDEQELQGLLCGLTSWRGVIRERCWLTWLELDVELRTLAPHLRREAGPGDSCMESASDGLPRLDASS